MLKSKLIILSVIISICSGCISTVDKTPIGNIAILNSKKIPKLQIVNKIFIGAKSKEEFQNNLKIQLEKSVANEIIFIQNNYDKSLPTLFLKTTSIHTPRIGAEIFLSVLTLGIYPVFNQINLSNSDRLSVGYSEKDINIFEKNLKNYCKEESIYNFAPWPEDSYNIYYDRRDHTWILFLPLWPIDAVINYVQGDQCDYFIEAIPGIAIQAINDYRKQ